MTDEKIDIFQSKREEIYNILHGWYLSSWGCKGLNNDEIDDEFSNLYNDAAEAECTCNDCNGDLLEKYMTLLISRIRITESDQKLSKFSIAMVINSLSHLAEVNKYCSDHAPDHAMEDMLESYYWMGVLMGAEREREDYGMSRVLKKASDVRHAYNRERSLKIKNWYRKNRKKYNNKDDAAIDAAKIHNLSISAARKHLRRV